MIRSWAAILFGLAAMTAFFWFSNAIGNFAYPPCASPEGMVRHCSYIFGDILMMSMVIPMFSAAIGLLGLVGRGPLARKTGDR